jgi:hypothetical protein
VAAFCGIKHQETCQGPGEPFAPKINRLAAQTWPLPESEIISAFMTGTVEFKPQIAYNPQRPRHSEAVNYQLMEREQES